MKQQQFLTELITKREKQILVLKELNILPHLIPIYEADIVLAQIQFLKDKKKLQNEGI